MIPAEELERQERERLEKEEKERAEAEASTPWLWNPRTLDADDSDDEDHPRQRSATNNIYAAPAQNQTPERPASTQAPESFTSKGILQPTFSVKIVRTPEHYASPSPSRQGHRASAPTQIYASPVRSSTRGSSIDTTLSPSPTLPPRQTHLVLTLPDHLGVTRIKMINSNSNITLTLTLTLVLALVRAKPLALAQLQPLLTVPNNPHFPYCQPPSKNPLPAPPAEINFPTFSQFPNSSSTNATTIHTSPGTTNGSYIYYIPPSQTPNHSRTKSHSQPPHPQTSGTAILHSNGTSTVTTLTSSPPRSSSPIHLERTMSPAHLYPHSHHLHFDPSQAYSTPERPATTIPTSKPKRKTSTSSHFNGSSSSSSQSSPSKPAKGTRRRKGYWNRRGDHVTSDGYIVYAPGHLVYPQDLDDYPDGKDGGYQNEHGMRTKWASRPQISPKGGYESCIEWTEI
ncbi:hypothetical protein NP233_g12495 [Leucocoprinus birnbaumii]|uniref:Uncharacterized protein n=1 Tax=Leucocoprinus birnbaumii TaxID=56174 RepID=A0AAD5VFK6_9AGAR|nr:hypothetical protein NP233_g12495 [Leucocoprinus birnbaumii]